MSPYLFFFSDVSLPRTSNVPVVRKTLWPSLCVCAALCDLDLFFRLFFFSYCALAKRHVRIRHSCPQKKKEEMDREKDETFLVRQREIGRGPTAGGPLDVCRQTLCCYASLLGRPHADRTWPDGLRVWFSECAQKKDKKRRWWASKSGAKKEVARSQGKKKKSGSVDDVFDLASVFGRTAKTAGRPPSRPR